VREFSHVQSEEADNRRVLGLLLVLLTLYWCLYFQMIRPMNYGVVGRTSGIPQYRWNGTHVEEQKFWSQLFTPAHWVDRRVRPRKWNGVPPEISDKRQDLTAAGLRPEIWISTTVRSMLTLAVGLGSRVGEVRLHSDAYRQ